MIDEIEVHDLGFVKLLDIMGSDEEVENAARISYGEGTRKVSQTRNLIRYLMRHKHTSPFEMCEIKFHIKLPIFVMRQLVRHRTANLNEYSGRYSVMSNEFYLPEGDYLQKQSEVNRQGRGGVLEGKGIVHFEMNRIFDGAATAYQTLLNNDLTRELARIILPVSNYTEVIWKIDLHNFFHIIKLRMDKHAQQEIQDYSKAMYEMVKPHFPSSCEAFEDYINNSVTLSRMEINALQHTLKCFPDAKSFLNNLKNSEDLQFGLGKREWTELKEKFNE